MSTSHEISHPIASPEDWLSARRVLLEEEKVQTKLQDALSAKRRALPWVKVDRYPSRRIPPWIIRHK
ncbi:hypothetical protein BH09VER1_BH09VER1_20030 [soil metagenome]